MDACKQAGDTAGMALLVCLAAPAAAAAGELLAAADLADGA